MLCKEVSQLVDVDLFVPQDPRNVTKAFKKAALKLITLIKKNRIGTVKCRTCAGGRKKQTYLRK